MRTLIVLALVGLGAQLVDGGLGMGYGITSSTMLLAVGLSPATASASVHLAELGTTLVSGVSHWKLGNTDWRLVARLGIPGATGALAGATVLSRLSTEAAAPVMAVLLAGLGAYLLVRFLLRPPGKPVEARPLRRRFLAPLGLVGGFVDATGGGGWGPVTTTTLLGLGRTAPRTVVGSVSTSEFLVTLAASIGFVANLGGSGVRPDYVLALLVGGAVAAPLAAWLVSRLPSAVLGVGVGGLIVLTNLSTVLGVFGVSGPAQIVVPVVWAVVWAVLVAVAVIRHRRRTTAVRVAPADAVRESAGVG